MSDDKSEKPDKRARLAELIGTDSTNVLGTGLTMQEFMQLHRAEKLAASWCLQVPEERKRRRRVVIQLSQELGRVEAISGFATRLGELAIEAVIEGDWKMVQEWADHFGFDGEQEQIRDSAAPTWATFRELLLQSLRTDKELPA